MFRLGKGGLDCHGSHDRSLLKPDNEFNYIPMDRIGPGSDFDVPLGVILFMGKGYRDVLLFWLLSALHKVGECQDKCLNGLAPSYFTDYFICLAIHSRNLRRSGDLSLSHFQLSEGQQGFYFRRAKRGNDLPKDLQGIKDIKVLKKRLVNCVFKVYLSFIL